MMNTTMRPIHSLIDPKIVNRTQNIQALTTSLRSRLPSNLQEHCWVVDIIGNTLVLVTRNAETASILRYQQHELIKQINEEFKQSLATTLRRVKIKVDYNIDKLSSAKKAPNVRSNEAVRCAKQNCKNILQILED